MTYYKPSDVDFENWPIDDSETPEKCALRFMTDDDAGNEPWHVRNELMEEGKVSVTLDELGKTTDPLHGEQQFDGYEPGCEYYVKTGKTVTVLLRVVAEVVK